jgi:hypothetical protein
MPFFWFQNTPIFLSTKKKECRYVVKTFNPVLGCVCTGISTRFDFFYLKLFFYVFNRFDMLISKVIFKNKKILF